MASIAIGPGGVGVQGEHQCSNNDFLMDQGNPLGGLVNRLISQRITGITTLLYDPIAEAMDEYMPLRESTAERIDGTNHYHTDVGYTGLMNQSTSKSIMPAMGNYNNQQRFLEGCGIGILKNISSSANTNAEACNPSLGGPMPSVGREAYGREAFVTRLAIPPICFADFVNKEAFYEHLSAILRSSQNATLTLFGVDQLRWMISRTRFNAAPVQVPKGNGSAVLPDSADLFNPFYFNRVPQHWGSPDWFASMLRWSEVPPRQNVRVKLPAAIFRKYKEALAAEFGLNIWEQAENLTKALNGYTRTILNDTLVYQDEITGRKITFEATTNPLYVEVAETGQDAGTWELQEPWITRDSETAGQVMRRPNPNWGRACSCTGKVLAAIITVVADGPDKPFYKETLPGANPDSRLRGLIDEYTRGRGTPVNTTLEQMYPSALTTTMLTGLDAQRYALDPINQRYRDAGYSCDVVSNLKNTWLAGFHEISAQYVENRPREVANFMLLMPRVSSCVELSVPCQDEQVPAVTGDGFQPLITEPFHQNVPIPAPVDPPTPAAGLIQMLGNSTKVTAPCTGTKTVSVRFRRVGGTAGAISISLAATPTAHGGTVPATVNFADGQTDAVISWTIPFWICPADDTAPEQFNITLSGASLDPDTFTTRSICIKCAKNCPAECTNEDTSGCASCG